MSTSKIKTYEVILFFLIVPLNIQIVWSDNSLEIFLEFACVVEQNFCAFSSSTDYLKLSKKKFTCTKKVQY